MLFLTQTIDNQRQISAVDLADPKTTYVIHKGPAGGGGPGRRPDAANPPGNPPGSDSDAASDGDEEEQRRGPGGAGGPGGAQGLMTRSGPGLGNVVRVSSAGEVYISGADRARGDTKGFPKPYIDKINIKTGDKTRIFEGKGEMLETINAVDSDDIKLVFTTRQKPPNEKGFVGFETVWEPFQKEVEYKTPKKP